MDISILYEDEQIVIIEKSSGVVSNRAQTVKTVTIQDWMENRYHFSQAGYHHEDEKYFVERAGLVHRLDKETSGVMVLAKNPESFEELLRQFREREVSKAYLALTHGLWKLPEGRVELPIGRTRRDRKLMGVREDGRESVTRYRVEREFTKGKFPAELKVEQRGYAGFSLVTFWPETGRMHQIRVHAKHLGHPLVGDEQYAGRKRSREDRKWCGRLMLHAAYLEITHPTTGERVSWGSGGDELIRAMKYLE